MRNVLQTKRQFDKELVSLLKMRGPNAKRAQIEWQHDPDVISWCMTHEEHWLRLVVTYGNGRINGYTKLTFFERR